MRPLNHTDPAIYIPVRLTDGSGFYVAGGGGAAVTADITAWGGVATSLGQKVMAASVPVVLASNQSSVPVAASQAGGWSITILNATLAVTQSGAWTVAATQSGAWTVAATQSGAWTTGRTWTLLNSTDSVTAHQGGAPWTVSQSGAWSMGRTWTLASGTDAVSAVVTTLPVDTYSAVGSTASASGNNTIHTPAASNRIRLQYISLSADGANSADVVAIVKFTAGGATLYKVSLKPGSTFARNIGAGRRYLDGGVNNALVVNLSTAQSVHVSIEYDETT